MTVLDSESVELMLNSKSDLPSGNLDELDRLGGKAYCKSNVACRKEALGTQCGEQGRGRGKWQARSGEK